MPPHDTAATLARLTGLVERFASRTLLALGDSFHDTGAGARIGVQDRETLLALTRRLECVWIEGNHDPEAPAWLPGRRSAEWREGAVIFRHEPGGPLPEGQWAEVAGHLHPCAKVAGASGRRVRRRCFAHGGQRFVLPAFGAFTGGLNVLDPAFQALLPPVFTAHMLGATAVHAVPSSVLEPDRGGVRPTFATEAGGR